MLQSVLQVFYILFKSDSKEVKKGAEEAEKSTDQLNESLKKVNVNTDRVGESFVAIGRSLVGVVSAFAAAGAVLSNLKEAYDYTLNIKQASEALNVNAADLDAWGQVVKKNGGTVEGFQASIKGLAQSLNFRNQDAIKFLPQLAEMFKNAGTERSQRLGQNLGIDERLILTLIKAGSQIGKVIEEQKKLNAANQKSTEVVEKFNEVWNDSSSKARQLWTTVDVLILPILSKLISKFGEAAKYVSENQNIIVGALIGLGIAIAIFAAPIIVANAAVIGLYAFVVVLIAAFALWYDKIVELNEEFRKLPGIAAIEDTALKALKTTIDDLLHPLRTLLSLLEKVKSVFDFGTKIGFDIPDKIKNQLSIANDTSGTILAGGGAGIFNTSASNSKNSAVQIGEVTINTQATDGKGIAETFGKHINDYFRQATGTFDDGVSA